MKTIKTLILACAFVLYSLPSICQGFIINPKKCFGSVWELDKELINKQLSSNRYLTENNNVLYNLDFYPSRQNNLTDQTYEYEYYFLTDSAFNVLTDYSNEELVSLFNDIKNMKILSKDSVFHFKDEIETIDVILLSKYDGKVIDVQICAFQFFDDNSFSQYYYGEAVNQPQMGYVYKVAVNVPNEIMLEIQKNNPTRYRKIINMNRANIFSSPNQLTKMYLLKNDVVEVLEDKDEWLKIRYYGKKTIEGWIKKSDVE